jgi:hypothetical protein
MSPSTQQILRDNPELADEMILDFVTRKRQGNMANFTEPVDANKQENPNLYKHIPYPKMLHHQKTGATKIVQNKAEHEAQGPEWGTHPIADPIAHPVVKSAGMDDPVNDERVDSLEARVLSIEALLAEILERLPKKK